MERAAFRDWLNRWLTLWAETNPDPAEFEKLFTEDASWAYQPFETGRATGRRAIVDRWLENIDPPGSWEADYHVLAVDGEVGIAEGRSRYVEAGGAARDVTFYKLLVCRFAPDGRCRELIEWYMEAPGGA